MPTGTIQDHETEKMRVLPSGGPNTEGSTQVGINKMNRAIEQESLPISAIPETSNFSPEKTLPEDHLNETE